MKKITLSFALFTAALCCQLSSKAQSVFLDSTFHHNGLQDSISSQSGITNGIAIQPDGKIVAALGRQNMLSLYRLNSDGSKDNTFGTGGIFEYDHGTFGSQTAHDVAVQPDGKILMLGEIFIGGQNKNAFLMRLENNGTPDNTFGTGGIVTTNSPGGNTQDYPTKILIRPNGKILVAGIVNTLSNDDQQLVIQYNTDGSLDAAFGTGGIVKATIPGSRTDGIQATLQPDGKIIVVGSSISGSTISAAIGRYNTDGSLDATFDSDGWQTYSMAGALSQSGIAVGVQSTGKIVVGIRTNKTTTIYAIRYNSDGSRDNTFGASGLFSYEASPSEWSFQNALLVLPGDDLLIGGDLASGTAGGFYDYGLLRLTEDGGLRTNWGNGGIVHSDFRVDYDNLNALALQPDGKIVAGGSSRNGDNTTLSYPSIARYKSNLTTTPNSIASLSKNASLLAYPNPVSRLLYLQSSNQECTVMLTNYIGQVMFSQLLTASNSYTAVVANLKPGIYFASTTLNNQQIKVLVVQ